MNTPPRRSLPSGAMRVPFPDPDCNGISEFRDKLSCFTGEHYIGSHKPYVFLLCASRSKVVYYDQFSEVLVEDAVQKGADQDHVRAQINHVKHNLLLPENYGIPILELINNIYDDTQNRSKVSVVPLMCGAGKSTAISYKIKEVLEAVDGTPEHTDGILIVTDSIDRMEEYIDEKNERNTEPYIYLKANRNRIALLQHGDDWKTATIQREQRPVLIISTQRYFQTPKEKIEESFLRWDHGCRPLIIFDERIPLKDVVQIDRTAINTVASALCDKIEYAIADSEDEEQTPEENASKEQLDQRRARWEDKKWCIEQWESIRERIYAKIEEYEQMYTTEDYHLYCDWSLESVTEDDERFMSFVEANRRYLFMDNCNVLKMIRAVFSMMTSGALYHCMKRENQYENVFSIVVDNTDLITDLSISDGRKAKVIVLDGTGDVHPDTALRPLPDYIDMRDENGDKYKRWLDMLTIHFVNEATGKVSFTGEDSSDKKKRIRAYLKELRRVSADASLPENTLPVVFTYKSVESYFKNAKLKTEHFNNIKGKNDYRLARLIAQVGLNKMPLWYGLAYYLDSHPEWRNELCEMGLAQTREAIQNVLNTDEELKEINARFLLTDLEQNMFRCAIRNSNFVQTAHYYILTKADDAVTQKLLSLMHDRYDPRKAQIISNEEMPEEFAKQERVTIKGAVLQYFKDNVGPFTAKQVVEGVEQLSNVQQFRTACKAEGLKGVIIKIPGTQTYDLASRVKLEVN